MKRRISYFYVITLIFTILAAGGCREERQSAPLPGEKGGAVRASPAYVDFFGRPPTVEKGTCYAYVGFYPSAQQKQKVRPFPLFLFDREEHPRIIVEQLLSWGRNWDLGGVFSDPFPLGSALISLEREGDLLRLELSSEVLEQADAGEQRSIVALLGHSLTQFEGVDRVMVVAGGTLLPGQAERGFVPDPEALAEPGPPVALIAAATWEESAEHPVEISVFFDRPVRIDTFRLTDASGKEFGGKYYRSVFDMAVVIHPDDPTLIVEGMPVHLSWKGEDFLDRKGRESRDFTLRRIEHP